MRSKYFCLAFIALVSHGLVHAQKVTIGRLTISTGAAYEQSVFDNGAVLVPPSKYSAIYPCTCMTPRHDPLTGYDVRVGALYSILPSVEAGIRLERSRLDGESIWELPMVAILLEGSGGIPANQSLLYREKFQMETVRTDLVVHSGLPVAGLAIEAGLTIAYRRFLRARRTQELIEPQDARFKNPDGIPTENNGRVFVYYDGTWPESNHIVTGAVAGLTFTIPIVKGLSIVPEALLRKEFVPPKSGSPWPSYFVSAGMSVAYTF
jgi:hypothetical protein